MTKKQIKALEKKIMQAYNHWLKLQDDLIDYEDYMNQLKQRLYKAKGIKINLDDSYSQEQDCDKCKVNYETKK